jgi:plasmid stability protein
VLIGDDFMPDVLVRDVEDGILLKLKERAKENGRSLQNELIQVFRTLVEGDNLSDEIRADEIKNSLRGRVFSDSATLLREDRNR